jgi:diguanylate cyclase (GGDEF)-like protein
MHPLQQSYFVRADGAVCHPTGSAGIIMARLVDWLISGPRPQPAPIVRRLLLHTQTKKRTLILAILSTTLMTAVAAGITGAIWAYVWLAVEIGFGIARYSALAALTRDEAAGRQGNAVWPLYISLSWGCSYAIGCGLCVLSGEAPLILLAGIVIAGLSGGISSRNAGTPRYGITLIYLLGTPYTWAMIFSPIPYMYLIGLLVPIWGVGVAFILLENYEVLLHLFLSERENEWLAKHDPLTGLPNRVMKRERIEELLRISHGTGQPGDRPLTVFCLDLDGFKGANDRHGHAAGDAVLTVVAERLRASVRDQDSIFRVGGDEFVVLLPDTEMTEANVVAQRIISRISEPFHLEGHGALQIGVSIGSATFPHDGGTADDLLRSADGAMYRAKRQRKGLFAASDDAEDAAGLVPAPDADRRAGWPRAVAGADRNWCPPASGPSLAIAPEIRITVHPQIPAGS